MHDKLALGNSEHAGPLNLSKKNKKEELIEIPFIMSVALQRSTERERQTGRKKKGG